MIEAALAQLHVLLVLARAQPSEAVLFGSVTMWLRGLKDEIGDIDVFVSRRVYDEIKGGLSPIPVSELEPREGDPPFLEVATEVPLHVFCAWTERDNWLSVEECFARSHYVFVKRTAVGLSFPRWQGPWRCIPLELVYAHKVKALATNPDSADHEKHRRDLDVLARAGVQAA